MMSLTKVAPFTDLLKAARTGSEGSMGALLEPYIAGLSAYVRLRLKPQAVGRTAELCEEVISRASEGIATFSYASESSLRKWVFLIAEQCTADPRGAAHPLEVDDVDSVVDLRNAEAGLEQDARGAEALLESYRSFCGSSMLQGNAGQSIPKRILEIERVFRALPHLHREVILLVRVAGFSDSEVANRLSCSVGLVRHHLHRAMGLLADGLRA